MTHKPFDDYEDLVDEGFLPDEFESNDAWATDANDDSSPAANPDWSAEASLEQVQLLLSAVADSGAPKTENSRANPNRSGQKTQPAQERINLKRSGQETQPTLDRELMDAYMDDAQRCLASAEQIVLALASGPQYQTQLRSLCRELHTLKGASASVGFQQLAADLHRLEDVVEADMQSGAAALDRRMLLGEIDSFRQQVAALTGRSGAESPLSMPEASATPVDLKSEVSANEETLRVRASQVDRLMDMLAELVMLRNRRDSRVEQLKDVHGRLWQFVSHLRTRHALNYGQLESAVLDADGYTEADASDVESLGREVNELLDIARVLRDLFEPMAEEQRGISRFIGQFRQELTDLRRLPIAGLFQRLKRAVHDAAQLDGKHVRLRFVGEQTGLERSLQERLYEPLLHIVRNAVSHGIENEADRLACGKDSSGTITLEATGGTNLLVVSVRDDGRGLNYDALRRRGAEMGLIDADRQVTRDELAQLIFRPGFSTQASTTQVAGRGVGMDVVAATLERLHGWVELESTPGQGTHIRLVIPRRSVIEHALVFRVGKQLLALPMQFVHEIAPHEPGKSGRANTTGNELKPIHFSQLFSLETEPATSGNRVLVLASTTERLGIRNSRRSRIALAVDDVVGPQEVVVRPLPVLLRGHPLLSGISLSATGDIVLLLHSQRLAELAMSRSTVAATDDLECAATTPNHDAGVQDSFGSSTSAR